MTREVERSEEEWRETLPPDRYAILRGHGTEPAFSGELLHNHEQGTYHCAACGAELFASDAKFDSGSGWPSFWSPASEETVELRQDTSHGMIRKEVLCRRCGSHLGHVFDDGPQPTGQRWCINSLALGFERGEDE